MSWSGGSISRPRTSSRSRSLRPSAPPPPAPGGPAGRAAGPGPRLRRVGGGGRARLRASLQSPWVRWRPPVLEVLTPTDYDVPLNGRGIALVPSVFVGQVPSLHTNPNDPGSVPWLVVPPADGRMEQRHLWGNPQPTGAALAALAGRNPAAVLRTIADGCSTTELAGRMGISLPPATQHASVLRDAGLITTPRH